eukprot:1790102-Rhodomonas_salina.8
MSGTETDGVVLPGHVGCTRTDFSRRTSLGPLLAPYRSTSPIVLCTCYAVSGTDLGCGCTRCVAGLSGQYCDTIRSAAYAVPIGSPGRRVVPEPPGYRDPFVLRACYAMSGTNTSYAATRRGGRRLTASRGGAYRATRVLCDVRY